jgi:hypothetical protein
MNVLAKEVHEPMNFFGPESPLAGLETVEVFEQQQGLIRAVQQLGATMTC